MPSPKPTEARTHATNALYTAGLFQGRATKVPVLDFPNGFQPGAVVSPETLNDVLNNHGQHAAWLLDGVDQWGASTYGNGRDGVVNITGNTTLTANIYATTLNVDPGVVINTAGFRIYASERLNADVDFLGFPVIFHNDGLNASGSTPGAFPGNSSAPWAQPGAGGTGGTASNEAGGSPILPANNAIEIGAQGGNGGASDQPGAGGTGAEFAQSLQFLGGLESSEIMSGFMLHSGIVRPLTGGRGGAGGGGANSNDGGGGGGPGGIVSVYAKSIRGGIILRSEGGNGASGVTGGQEGGAGGGGGGGAGIVCSRDYDPTELPNFDLDGGLGGTLGANPGNNGTAGRSFILVM